MLLRQASAAGVSFLEDTRIVEERIGRDGRWRLLLNGPLGRERAASPIVVDASGRAASFARRHGAQRKRIDRLIASSAGLESSASAPPCEGVTLVEAAENGWWYSTPQPDGRLAVTYFTDPDTESARMARTADGWWNLMSQTEPTRERIERHHARLIGVPRVVAAGSSLLDRITGDGWLAVGDAAATHDPLSSHGIGAALDGGQRAAAAILAHLAGDAHAFRRYAIQIVESYAQYLWMWRAYYAEERRWPDAPFWRRRHRFAEVGPPLLTYPRRQHTSEPMRGQSPAAAISTGIDLPA
jgi:flavin-dependent dehydrogenase